MIAGGFHLGFSAGITLFDPPRANFRTGGFCNPMTIEALQKVSRSVTGHQMHRRTLPIVKSSSSLMTSVLNSIAALEYLQGATIEKDAEWAQTHCGHYVEKWNETRSLIIDVGKDAQSAGSMIREVFGNDEKLTALVDAELRDNAGALEANLQERYRQFLLETQKLCPEVGMLLGMPIKI